MSVRAVEERVRTQRSPTPATASSASPGEAVPSDDPHVRYLENELQRLLGTPVRIHLGKAQTGRVEIPFYNPEDFDRVMELLLGSEASQV